ncbi:hypothetical protein ASG85_20505 [Paenibacillus sp. Soil724D2]|nr:hypothetical protein ASG85_20505 [Paenibacillus sp. Soil724D2]
MPISTQQKNDSVKSVFSVLELSHYLGVSTDCIYAMVRESQIPYIRIRRRILFHKEAIDVWINSGQYKT